MLHWAGFEQIGEGGRALDEAAQILAANNLIDRSGGVLLSAEATLTKGPIYFIGTNPGGEDPGPLGKIPRVHEAMAMSRMGCSGFDQDWSTDKKHFALGKAPMQLRFKHIAQRLGLAYGEIAATNFVFSRSRNVAEFAGIGGELGPCLRVHARFLEIVQPTTIWLMGSPKFALDQLTIRAEWKHSGHGDWTIGRGEIDLFGKTYPLCHTPHLSIWDPVRNHEALEWAFEAPLSA